MDIHQNARLTLRRREELVRRHQAGASVRELMEAFAVTEKTVRKWVRRFREGGAEGLRDGSSRPHRSPRRTPPQREREVEQLRRQHWCGAQIAQAAGLSRATVFRVLRRLGLSRLSALEPALPIQRYEHAAPGELIHLDLKRLARFHRTGHRITGDRRGGSPGAGWEFLHVAIDDHSRVAFSALQADERAPSAGAFLESVVARYRALGVVIRRVLTDNGACYRSRAFGQFCRRLGLKHIFTRPYTPRTNGKAERFIQTALREWAYSTAYQTSAERADHLPRWLHRYNWHRPHASLSGQVPVSRLGLAPDNLSRLHN